MFLELNEQPASLVKTAFNWSECNGLLVLVMQSLSDPYVLSQIDDSVVLLGNLSPDLVGSAPGKQ